MSFRTDQPSAAHRSRRPEAGHRLRSLLALIAGLVLVGGCTSAGSSGTDPVATRLGFASEPTAEPTAAETVEPTPKSFAVKVTKLTRSVRPGGTASVTIATVKYAECSISVTYDSGPSEAAGLVTKKANGKGAVTWKWMVGRNTGSGEYPIDIFCTASTREGQAHATFRVP